jgi:hypothetical protein
MNTRRTFLRNLVTSVGSPALLCSRGFAQTPPPAKLEETDPVAMAFGFKLDTTKVSAQKYPLHTNEQKCAGCTLYQDKPGETSAPCTAFGGKLVPTAGWCAAYAKKPEAGK